MSLFDANWALQGERLLPPVLRGKDFIEKTGDFKTGLADNEYIGYAVLSAPGHWKEFPTMGVNIWRYLQSRANPLDIARSIRVDLQSDIFSSPMVDATKFPVIRINSVTIELGHED